MTKTLPELLKDVNESITAGYYDIPNQRERDPISLILRVQSCKEGARYPIIAECKPKSPMRPEKARLSPRDALCLYSDAGLAGISVLTEPSSFGGSLDYLTFAHQLTSKPGQDMVPLLMKDVVVDTKQVQAGYNAGADAVLLIAKAFGKGMDDERFKELYQSAREFKLGVVLEVSNAEEYQQALALEQKPALIGINNRNLLNMNLDSGLTGRLIGIYGKRSVPVIAMSGYENPNQIREAINAGADAVLVGTSIMNAENPTEKLKELCEAGRQAVFREPVEAKH